jgi:hypothetical protein
LQCVTRSTAAITLIGACNGARLSDGRLLLTSNVLQSVGTLSNKPANCVGIDSSGAAPSDYVQVQVTYKYVPLFKGITVIYAMGITSIKKTSWVRVG